MQKVLKFLYLFLWFGSMSFVAGSCCFAISKTQLFLFLLELLSLLLLEDCVFSRPQATYRKLHKVCLKFRQTFLIRHVFNYY